jgi:hypothetical protein
MSTFEAFVFANEIESETLVRVWNKTQNDDKTVTDVEKAKEDVQRIYAFRF